MMIIRNSIFAKCFFWTTIFVVFSFVSKAELEPQLWKNIDIIPENSEFNYLNFTSGVAFITGDFSANLMMLDITSSNRKNQIFEEKQDAEDAVKATLLAPQAKAYLESLFVKSAEGIRPNLNKNRLYYYLTPKIIGAYLGELIGEKTKAVGASQSSGKPKSTSTSTSTSKWDQVRRKFKTIFLFNEGVPNDGVFSKLEKERQRLCAEGKDYKFGPFPTKKFNFYCVAHKDISLKILYENPENILFQKNFKKNVTNFMSAFDRVGIDLLVTRVILGALWFKVENRQQAYAYYTSLQKHLNKHNHSLKFLSEFGNANTWFKDRFSSQELVEFKQIDKFSNEISEAWQDASNGALLYSKLLAAQRVSGCGLHTLIPYGRVTMIDGSSFSDCGINSFRNFVLLLLKSHRGESDENEEKSDEDIYKDRQVKESERKYDLSPLIKLGASNDITLYFKEYPTPKSQLTQQARDKWGKLLSKGGGNGIEYIDKVRQQELGFGKTNMLNLIRETLFTKQPKNEKPKTWQELEKKLQSVFQGFSLQVRAFENDDDFGSIDFALYDKKYTWEFRNRHFFIKDSSDNHENSDKLLGFLKTVGKHNNFDNMIFNAVYDWHNVARHDHLRWIEFAVTMSTGKYNQLFSRMAYSSNSAKQVLFLLSLDSSEKRVALIENFVETGTNLPSLIDSLMRLSSQDALQQIVNPENYTDYSTKNSMLTLSTTKSILKSYGTYVTDMTITLESYKDAYNYTGEQFKEVIISFINGLKKNKRKLTNVFISSENKNRMMDDILTNISRLDITNVNSINISVPKKATYSEGLTTLLNKAIDKDSPINSVILEGTLSANSMRQLGELYYLNELVLQNCFLKNKTDLSKKIYFTSLQTFTLYGCSITPENIANLTNNMPELGELSLLIKALIEKGSLATFANSLKKHTRLKRLIFLIDRLSLLDRHDDQELTQSSQRQTPSNENLKPQENPLSLVSLVINTFPKLRNLEFDGTLKMHREIGQGRNEQIGENINQFIRELNKYMETNKVQRNPLTISVPGFLKKYITFKRNKNSMMKVKSGIQLDYVSRLYELPGG